MATWRKIDTRIWNDRKFMDLSGDGKLAFLFILTHPSMTMLGAMRGTLQGLTAELESLCESLPPYKSEDISHISNEPIERHDFKAAFQGLVSAKLIEHDAKYCFISAPNFLKYNPPRSPNVVRSYAEALGKIPECAMCDALIIRVKAFVDALPKGFRDALPEAFRHIRAHIRAHIRPIQEQEQEREDIKEINKEMGDTPKPPAASKSSNQIQFPAPLQTDAFKSAWANWEAYRREIRKGLKPATSRAQLKKLSAWGEAVAIHAIEQSIAQGWTGLFEPDASRGGKMPITEAQRQNAEMTGQRTWESEMSPAGHLYAPFWRHPDDPIPTDEAKARAGEWESIKATMAEDMEPGDFEVFDRDGLVCEAVSDGRLWLVVAQRIDRAVIFRFTGGPRVREVAGRELHVAVDEGLDEVVVY